MTHPNEDLVRKGYAAFSSGDMEALATLLAPDLLYHVLAGTRFLATTVESTRVSNSSADSPR